MSQSIESLNAFRAIIRHLEGNKFKFDANEDKLIIRMTVHGDDLPQPTIIRILDDKQILQIISPIPGNIPEDKRIDAAVAAAVANYGIINGSFDFDMTDGEVRFRVAHCFRDSELSEKVIRYLLGITFYTTDKYNDRFFMLGKGMMSLSDFIQKEEEN